VVSRMGVECISFSISHFRFSIAIQGEAQGGTETNTVPIIYGTSGAKFAVIFDFISSIFDCHRGARPKAARRPTRAPVRSEICHAGGLARLPITNRRYSRLQVCVTTAGTETHTGPYYIWNVRSEICRVHPSAVEASTKFPIKALDIGLVPGTRLTVCLPS
jgi:hypothetical protein